MSRLLTCLAALACAGSLSAAPLLEKSDLWEAGKDGYTLYRIPGVIVTAKGTVLAYCEARKSDRGDWGPIDILMRRSTDGGKTFDAPRKIVDVPGPHKKNPVALAQKLASPDDVTYNNVVAIADAKGAVHLLCCLEYMRCFYQRSDDDGLTFSKPVEITPTFEAFRKDYDWKVLAVGPAHGIQMKNGRLVAPVWLSTGTGGHAHRPSVTSVIYSDDQGKTWQRGEIAVPNTADYVNPNETVIAQLADGKVMLNVRSESKNHRRLVTTSADGATGWSKPRFDDQLLEPICMGSICRLTEKPKSDKNRLLFANPHTLDPRPGQAEKPGAGRDRKNLAIKLSYDEGETWPVSRVLEPGGSGYSDLAVLPDGTILCLFERGSTDGKSHTSSKFLTLARCNLEWLSEGKDKLAAAPRPEGKTYDLVTVGATPGGVAMAVRAAREGLDVLLVTHSQHLGGMLAEGLSVWDTQYEGRRAPIYDELRAALFDHYKTRHGEKSQAYRDALPGKTGHSNGKYEASVAEAIITALVAREPRITVLKGYYPSAVGREGALLKSVTLQEMDGDRTLTVAGKVFADCTYEGDLLATAKTAYRVGREARTEYNEPHAGRIFLRPVAKAANADDARVHDLNKRLNLRPFNGFWEIQQPASTGAGDALVQAFNFRVLLTTNPDNRIPVARPAGYDPERLKALEFGEPAINPVPNRKVGLNRPQLVGPHQAYVEGAWSVRRRVAEEHRQATLGLIYFRQNDPSVPEKTRAVWKEYGLPKDEFTDNGGFPRELYVREARRLTGRAVFTQHDAMLAPGLGRAPIAADSIAITEWYMDAHASTLDRVNGSWHEGKMGLWDHTFPGQVSYRCLLAKALDNLLVPVCLSATHVAWGTIRLEPTWMHLGESAGFAAAQAVRMQQAPAAIDVPQLQRTLAERRVMLGFFNDVDVSANTAWVPAVEYFSARGYFPDYDAKPTAALDEATAKLWAQEFMQTRAGKSDPTALAKALTPLAGKAGAPITAHRFAELLAAPTDGAATDADAPLTRGEACRLLFAKLAAAN